MQFYLFFIFPGYKNFLLEEIKLRHPKLTLSFSNKEFVSMKGPANYERNLKKKPILFTRRMGVFLDKSSQPEDFCILVKEGEYWNYEKIETSIDTFDLKVKDKPENAPARAWHKIDEVCELFNWQICSGDNVIEIGSAPGGISYFVLEKGANLVCIDPAEMDAKLKKIKHIKQSIFEVKKNQLPKKCDWLISDLNLNGDLNISQCKRIADYYPQIKGGFITIKTPNLEDLKNFDHWSGIFKKFQVQLFHLPSHKSEIGLFFIK